MRIQTSCHNIQIKHRSRQPPCEAEARRRLVGGQQKQKQGDSSCCKFLPNLRGGTETPMAGVYLRAMTPPAPVPGILRRNRAAQQFSEKKQGQMAAGETSREKKHPVKYPAGDVPRCESLFLPWWRGRPGAWWHSRRPAGFKECGKRQRRVKEPQSGREGGGIVEGVSLETQGGNATPP